MGGCVPPGERKGCQLNLELIVGGGGGGEGVIRGQAPPGLVGFGLYPKQQEAIQSDNVIRLVFVRGCGVDAGLEE